MERRHVPKIRGGRPAPAWLLDYAERNMHALGPAPEVVAEWELAGLALPDLPTIRRYRLGRVQQELQAAGCDAALLYDPVNVRYATDTTNMSIWTAHNQVRYAFVPADGPVIVFEYSNGECLSAHSEIVDEIRPATSYWPFYVGDRRTEIAQRWAQEIADALHEVERSGRRRLACDVLTIDGVRALEAEGVEIVSGMHIMEDARLVKHPEEIVAMRCAVHACQSAIDDMRAIFEPGVTEVALWARLQESNFLRFGEWIETRLLCSGDRTNPWYQEASSKVVEAGEILAFDTDMIAAYGMCVDMSRSWICGDRRPTAAQADLFGRAEDMLERNAALLIPGATYQEVTDKATYADPAEFHGYTVLAHGVGMADEYPSIYTRELWEQTGFDGVVEVGNVISVEAFVGRRDGGEGVKLEQQYVITDQGPDLLTNYPLG